MDSCSEALSSGLYCGPVENRAHKARSRLWRHSNRTLPFGPCSFQPVACMKSDHLKSGDCSPLIRMEEEKAVEDADSSRD